MGDFELISFKEVPRELLKSGWNSETKQFDPAIPPTQVMGSVHTMSGGKVELQFQMPVVAESAPAQAIYEGGVFGRVSILDYGENAAENPFIPELANLTRGMIDACMEGDDMALRIQEFVNTCARICPAIGENNLVVWQQIGVNSTAFPYCHEEYKYSPTILRSMIDILDTLTTHRQYFQNIENPNAFHFFLNYMVRPNYNVDIHRFAQIIRIWPFVAAMKGAQSYADLMVQDYETYDEIMGRTDFDPVAYAAVMFGLSYSKHEFLRRLTSLGVLFFPSKLMPRHLRVFNILNQHSTQEIEGRVMPNGYPEKKYCFDEFEALFDDPQ